MNKEEIIRKLDPYVKEVTPAKLITITPPMAAVFKSCFCLLLYNKKGYLWFGSYNDLKNKAIEIYSKSLKELTGEYEISEFKERILKHIKRIPSWKKLTDEELVKEAETTYELIMKWWALLGEFEGPKFCDIEVFVDPFIKEKNLDSEEIALFKESLHLEGKNRETEKELELIEFIKKMNGGISDLEFEEKTYLIPKYAGYDGYKLYTIEELRGLDVEKLKEEVERKKTINSEIALNKLKKKIKITEEEEEKIRITRFISHILDERRYFANLLNMSIHILVEEFSKRTNRDKSEFWDYTLEEFIQTIKGEKINTEMPKLFYNEKVETLLSGEEASKIFLEIEKELEKIGEKEKILNGFGASPGIIEGKVRIVLDPHENALENGEILVTYFTNPEYVPLMKKARGIITECGGVTSHAAIVSREFGVPCIVGVKNAVIHLRDGQRVKMDGAKGIVEILE